MKRNPNLQPHIAKPGSDAERIALELNARIGSCCGHRYDRHYETCFDCRECQGWRP